MPFSPLFKKIFISGYERFCLGILIPGIAVAGEDDSAVGNKTNVRKPRRCNDPITTVLTEGGEWNLLDPDKNPTV